MDNFSETESFIDTSSVATKQVIEMFALANEYCVFIEQNFNTPNEKVLSYLGSLFPLLYLRGTLLPEIKEDYEYIHEKFVTEETWESVFLAYKESFGEKDEFTIFNNETEETQQHLMSEAIADIYQDLKDFIVLYSRNSIYAKMSAVDFTLKLFRERWGKIILSVLLNIHTILYSDLIQGDYE